jgi:hypothetical protein
VDVRWRPLLSAAIVTHFVTRWLLGRPRFGEHLTRSSMCGHPDPFRSVRDLGRVPARCSSSSGFPEGCSPRWLPVWLPAAEDLAGRLVCCGPSASQAGHVPSRHVTCECPWMLPTADGCRWPLVLVRLFALVYEACRSSGATFAQVEESRSLVNCHGDWVPCNYCQLQADLILHLN